MGSDLSDSCSVYPVKALRASSAALRPAVTGQPLPLQVVHAESDAFGKLGRMNLLLGRRQLDRQPGLPLVRQVVCLQKLRSSVSPDVTIPLNRCMTSITEQHTILLNRLRRVTQTSRTIQRNRQRLSQARQPSR